LALACDVPSLDSAWLDSLLDSNYWILVLGLDLFMQVQEIGKQPIKD
jgi:hypothetical protein